MSEINWLKVRKNRLFGNKKKQKNFIKLVFGAPMLQTARPSPIA